MSRKKISEVLNFFLLLINLYYFRCEAVRAIVKISHGCSEPVIIQDYSIWEEIKQLTTAISVRYFNKWRQDLCGGFIIPGI